VIQDPPGIPICAQTVMLKEVGVRVRHGAPNTIKELLSYRYGIWAGNMRGVRFEVDKCAHEVSDPRSGITRQCSRVNGYGKSGLYCKQHMGKK